MKRIMIIGSCGAGKSTLARQLHEQTGLELIHLDQAYWLAGWVETDKEEWRQKVKGLIQKECWIMDGNYGSTMELRLEKADTIIFLDRSRWVCLYRILKRILRYYGKTRPDMTAACPERLNWPFLMYVFYFPDRKRPQILKRLKQLRSDQQLFILKSDQAGKQLLQDIGKEERTK